MAQRKYKRVHICHLHEFSSKESKVQLYQTRQQTQLACGGKSLLLEVANLASTGLVQVNLM